MEARLDGFGFVAYGCSCEEVAALGDKSGSGSGKEHLWNEKELGFFFEVFSGFFFSHGRT
jgi:hypothetical protein